MSLIAKVVGKLASELGAEHSIPADAAVAVAKEQFWTATLLAQSREQLPFPEGLTAHDSALVCEIFQSYISLRLEYQALKSSTPAEPTLHHVPCVLSVSDLDSADVKKILDGAFSSIWCPDYREFLSRIRQLSGDVDQPFDHRKLAFQAIRDLKRDVGIRVVQYPQNKTCDIAFIRNNRCWSDRTDVPFLRYLREVHQIEISDVVSADKLADVHDEVQQKMLADVKLRWNELRNESHSIVTSLERATLYNPGVILGALESNGGQISAQDERRIAIATVISMSDGKVPSDAKDLGRKLNEIERLLSNEVRRLKERISRVDGKPDTEAEATRLKFHRDNKSTFLLCLSSHRDFLIEYFSN